MHRKRKRHVREIQKPWKMAEYWKAAWPIVLLIVVTGVSFNGSMFIGPVLQGRLIDAVAGGQGFWPVFHLAAIFVGIILLLQVLRMLKRYFVRQFANQTSASMRLMLYRNMMSRPAQELQQESTGDMMNKAVADVDICVEGMRKITTEVFDSGVLLAGYLISMLVYDWRMTLLACSLIPVSMLFAERMKKRIAAAAAQMRAQSSRVAQTTMTDVDEALLLRIHGLSGLRHDAYQEQLEDLRKKSVRSNVLETSMQPIYNAIATAGIAIIFWMGADKVLAGIWTVGTLSAYITIFTASATKASKAAKMFNSYQIARISWLRIRPYLADYQPEQEQKATEMAVNMLSLQNVCFRYREELPLALSPVSFSARAGQIVGVTGEVASGKTALGLALTGLYGYEGEIELDGAALRTLTPPQRSARISYMGHAPQLFSESIERNIALGETRDVMPALKDVCFDIDLQQMPEGIQTRVGNSGVRLSGGQQARISLARALYQKSGVLVLDDPFSAVDRETEKRIFENLRARYHDRIIIVLSHRLAMFPQMDQVLYLRQNEPVQAGTHEELMEQCAPYRALVEMQEEKV